MDKKTHEICECLNPTKITNHIYSSKRYLLTPLCCDSHVYLLYCSMTKEGSGVYCALAICLDSLNNEGYADVFQVVRSLREQRPYILYSKVCSLIYMSFTILTLFHLVTIGTIQVHISLSCGVYTNTSKQ